MKSTLSLLIAIVCVFTVQAQSQDPNTSSPVSLSLKECIDYAVKNSAAAKNAHIGVALQKAQNAEVTGRTLPQISAEGKYTQFIDIQKMFIPGAFMGLPTNDYIPVAFSPKLSSVGQINASQLLFNGSVFVALQARNTLMLLARQKETMSLEEIRYNVQKAYAALLVAQKQYAVLKSSLALVHQSTQDLETTYKNGLVEKIEVSRMQVQQSNLESDSLNLANMIQLSESLLKYTIGMDLNTPIVLSDNIETCTQDAETLLFKETDLENNSNIQLAKTAVRLMEYDLKRYRFEGLPTLAAFGSAGYNRSGNDLDGIINKPYPGFSLVGLQLTFPIFDGLQRYNRVKAAKLNLQKAENDLENARLGMQFQTQTARTTLANALKTAESRKRTMDLATDVLTLAQKKYKAGVGSNQDVVLAQSDFLKAQSTYFEAVLSIVNAKADLEKAAGLLK